MRDPIAELVTALDNEGKPRFVWVVRWSLGERDPVAVAWERSCSPPDLVRLLEIAAHPAITAAREILRAPFLWDSTDRDRARAEAIRRLVPVPPTLSELLAARGLLTFTTLATAV